MRTSRRTAPDPPLPSALRSGDLIQVCVTGTLGFIAHVYSDPDYVHAVWYSRDGRIFLQRLRLWPDQYQIIGRVL